MSSFLSSARVALERLCGRYVLDGGERAFLSERRRQEATGTRLPVLLVQCPEDPAYLHVFSWVVQQVRSDARIAVEQFVPRSIRPGATRSPLAFAKALLWQNTLTDRKWVKLYGAFCDRVGYRSASLGSLRDELKDLGAAWRIWRGGSSLGALLSIHRGGVPIGDLIYDTYLRFKPAPSLQLRDPYLLAIIWQALRDLRRAGEYFAKVRPAIYLTTYCTYIQHGIAVRVALRAGTAVYSFGNYQEFAKRLTASDWVHPRNPDDYRQQFAAIPDPEAAVAAAESRLAARLGGGIDSATAYMRQSAYAASSEVVPDVHGCLVVFLHDFFDSPHCYRWMLFPDFWVWITATLQLAREKNLRLFVKPHPNQIAESEAVVGRLQELFPDMPFLSPRITNVQLAAGGIRAAVTVYGTVAHELAYLGVPTVASGDHPHVAFDFCKTARTVEEYGDLLVATAVDSPDTAAGFRRQSLEFYFMHNLCFPDAAIELRDLLSQVRVRVAAAGFRFPEIGILDDLRQAVMTNAAFRESCASWADLLRSRI